MKIRGFRIELGEIESQLLKHAGVREAVVLAREDVSGDKRLVAYYTSDESDPDVESLRGHLQQQLPQYMVPAALCTPSRRTVSAAPAAAKTSNPTDNTRKPTPANLHNRITNSKTAAAHKPDSHGPA